MYLIGKHKLIFTAFLLFFSFLPGFAQGILKESLSVQSKKLGRQVNYSIYLPPGYVQNTMNYPVVYLLHGYSDDETGWVQFGEAHLIADKAIAAGEIPPMIIVMPDAGLSYYANDEKGEQPFEDFFITEFIPHIEENYRIRKKKEFRGIAGLSMGGYGALIYAMHHPELFSAASALSAGVRTDAQMAALPQERFDNLFGHLYGKGLEGKDRITGHWHKNSPIYMAQTYPEEELKKVRWYIDCGDADYLTVGNATLHIAFYERATPHAYRVREGAHTWSYWRSGLPQALKFIGESFRR